MMAMPPEDGAIEAKVDSAVRTPGMGVKRNNFAISGVNHGKIPQQHVDTELSISPHQIVQEIAEGRRDWIFRIETQPAIKLPAGDQDKPLSGFER